MNKQKKGSILLVYQNFSSFVRYDYLLLRQNHEVILFGFRARKNPFQFIWEYIRFSLFFIRKIAKIKIIYCWFADYHSFLPALLAKISRKRFFLSVGGYDAIYIPELKYGVYSNFFRSFCARYSITNAMKCLCVSESLVNNLSGRFGHRVRPILAPPGFDPEKFTFDPAVRKDLVLTVGKADDEKIIKIKGLDRFVEVSRCMPDFKFVIVGIRQDARKYLGVIPDNLEIHGFIPDNELLNLFRRARVYAQFSIDEGLPNAVCEAMLSGCIPVGTRAGGIPTAMGPFGLLLEHWNAIEAKKLIEEAFDKDTYETGLKVREYILTNFTLEKRANQLNEIFFQ